MKIKSSAAPEQKPAGEPGWLIRPVERPSFTDSLRFPEDITSLSTKAVAQNLGYYTSMHAYAISELAKVKIQHLKARSETEVRRKNIQRTGVTYGKSKYYVDREVRLDKRVEELERMCHSIEAKEIEIEAHVLIFDKYAQALSRELTRRTSESKLAR